MSIQANVQWVGVLAFLLPYVEGDNIHKGMNVNWDVKQTGTIWVLDAQTRTMAQSRLKVFHCPADDPYATATGAWFSVHSFLVGPGTAQASARGFGNGAAGGSAELYGRTNYIGVSGAMGRIDDPAGWDTLEGVFHNRSTVKMSQLSASDGSSMTLMFGEALGDAPTGPRGFSFIWIGVGSLVTVYGFNEVNPNATFAFSSKHDGAVHFAFADGSVHRVVKSTSTTGTSWVHYVRSSGWHDGLVCDPSRFCN
jgi:prepilin-type processing-associated H-X9-DG protein